MPELLGTETAVALAPENAGAPPAAESPSAGRPIFAEAVKWAGRGTYTLADQALFSGANFLITVLLARSLRPAEYGAYSLAFAVFMLFAAVHAALLIEPMMVFAAGKYAKRFPTYLLRVFAGHLALVTPASMLLLGIALALGHLYSREVQQALLGLALSAVAILFFWIVRQSFYVLLRPDWGVIGGGLYFVLSLGSITTLRYAGRLSTFTVFLGMALAGVVTSGLMLGWFNPVWKADRGEPTFASTVSAHWRYGRWAMATSALAWFPGYCYYAVLPAWLGLEGAGALRALTNFALPVLAAISALSMLLLPLLVRHRHEGGPRKMTRTMLIFLAVFVLGASLYGFLFWSFRDRAFQIFYGGKYSQYSGWPLLLVTLLPAQSSMIAVLGSGLRALERPDRIFWCYVGSVLSTLAVGIPLAARYGVSGALLGWLSSSAVTILMMSWFYGRALVAEPVTCAEEQLRESI